jgi:general secretion pathway protein B
MSYILEALKKSEQERGHGSAPGIQTVHSSSLNYQAEKRSIWPWILISVVALNLVVLLYFIIDKNTPGPAMDTTTVVTAPATINKPVTHAFQTVPAAEVITPAPVQPPAAKQETVSRTIATAPAIQHSTPVAERQVLDIMQLPDDIRGHVPQMDFSAHVYSSNPVQRSVVINGRFMEEGESMNEDFVLKEITTTGVIMDFRGYLFHTSVITGWN